MEHTRLTDGALEANQQCRPLQTWQKITKKLLSLLELLNQECFSLYFWNIFYFAIHYYLYFVYLYLFLLIFIFYLYFFTYISFYLHSFVLPFIFTSIYLYSLNYPFTCLCSFHVQLPRSSQCQSAHYSCCQPQLVNGILEATFILYHGWPSEPFSVYWCASSPAGARISPQGGQGSTHLPQGALYTFSLIVATSLLPFSWFFSTSSY